MEEKSDLNIQYCKGIGPKRAKLFEKLGVFTYGDLLRLYPRGYIDFSAPIDIMSTHLGENAVIKATVVKKSNPVRIRKGMDIYKLTAADDSGEVEITFFNTPIPHRIIKEGNIYLFYGKMDGNMLKRSMSSPKFLLEDTKYKLSPIYPLTAGLSSKIISSAVTSVLSCICEDDIHDPLPMSLLKKYNFPSLWQSLISIHRPCCQEDIDTARERLIFEELLCLQIGLLMLGGGGNKPLSKLNASDYNMMEFYSILPFSLTNAQASAIYTCVCDMKKGVQMNRLIQGDVGSGKTIVAAALCYIGAKNGFQSVFMAPTEILARQHFSSLSGYFSRLGIRSQVLCGSTPKKEKELIKKQLADGEIQILFGTHAVIQDDVIFKNLFLTITDEQHRFGVAQRASLHNKGKGVHHLVMSATPIPRTLGLILYGDLDITVIDELPPGRKKIKTYITPERKRNDMYKFLKGKIDSGQQVYIVCPMIESDEEDSRLTSIFDYVEKLKSTPLASCRISLIHGKMKPSEKESVMSNFHEGKIDVLVSTTVIEVGVDVPGATVMVIEDAQMFGLSQLHQLRGRVGRGKDESFCFLLSQSSSPTSKDRLEFLCSCSDGFKIAEYDLKTRGPGNFFGHAQHGLPDLKIAQLLTNSKAIDNASRDAKEILQDDPPLSKPENKSLSHLVKAMFDKSGGTLD